MSILNSGASFSELSENEINAVAGGHPHETQTIECEVKEGEIVSCKGD